MNKPIIVAHRGLDEHAPENTLPAFTAALDLGLALEFDVRFTADREMVVIHDATVDRTTNGTGEVADMSLSELRNLDAGSWFSPRFTGERVPTLAELLRCVQGRARSRVCLVLETKTSDPGMEGPICDLLECHGLLRWTVGIGTVARSADMRRRFKAANPAFQSSITVDTPADLETAVLDECATWLYVRFVPSESQVRLAHGAGKRVQASGPDITNDAERALAAMRCGVDLVLSNHPLELADRWRTESGP